MQQEQLLHILELVKDGKLTPDEAANQLNVNSREGSIHQQEDSVRILSCNVDDMTPESISYALGVFRKSGALDAWWEPIGMKKDRPGILICVLCREEDRDEMIRLIFLHTSTIGIRELLCEREVLKRQQSTVETPWGPVRCKTSTGFGVTKTKPEFDDLSQIAEKEQLPLDEVRSSVLDILDSD